MIKTINNKIPFFSVIIPTFNRRESLERAITSLLNQTESDYECIVVDDGSNDETSNYSIELCREKENFKYIFHSNRKPPLSRNAGILAASGLFITFLDSDDEYHPQHLQIRKRILVENDDVQLLHGSVQVIGDEYVPDMNDPDKKVHINDCIVGGTFVIEKYSAIALGGFDNKVYGEDTLFYDKAREEGLIIAKTDAETYIYHRDRQDSICNNPKKYL